MKQMAFSHGMSRRRFVAGTLAAGACSAWAQSDIAQILVGFPPGGPSDVVARILIDQGLSEGYGKRLIVENRPGGSSLIATRMAARATPNGTTFLMSPAFLLTNAALYDKPGYEPLRDFVPVAPIGTTYLVFVVNASSPWKTMRDFVQAARARGAELNYGSAGAGTTTHLMGVALNQASGSKLTHVPYKGEASVFQDLLGQQVQSGFLAISTVRASVESGALRALAVATASRQPELPNVPTLHEAGVDHALFETDGGWFGLFAPAGTPADIAQKMASALQAVLAKAEVARKLGEFGIKPWTGPRDPWIQSLAAEYEGWKKAIAEANVRLTL